MKIPWSSPSCTWCHDNVSVIIYPNQGFLEKVKLFDKNRTLYRLLVKIKSGRIQWCLISFLAWESGTFPNWALFSALFSVASRLTKGTLIIWPGCAKKPQRNLLEVAFVPASLIQSWNMSWPSPKAPFSWDVLDVTHQCDHFATIAVVASITAGSQR